MINSSGLLKFYWYAATVSSKLKTNVPYPITIMELPLVIWKNKEGILSCILDRCNHRNAPLSKGKIVSDCLVCPYHGWEYNGDGQCVKIPSEGPNIERIPNKKVDAFPIIDKYGLIWIWPTLEKQPDKDPFPIPLINTQGWSQYYMTTNFENNVTNLVENFMDVPHTVYVHKGWFRETKKICIKAKVERTKDSVLVSYDQPNDTIGFFGWLVNPKRLPMKHTDNLYMPNVTRVDYTYGESERAFIITSTCTPISPLKTKVFTLITYKLGWINLVAKQFLKMYTRKVIDQDVWIMKVHGQNLKTFRKIDYSSTQVDFMHVYIESLRNHAQNPEMEFTPQPIVKQIEFWV